MSPRSNPSHEKTYGDSDGDGLTDDCELTVAEALAPWMMIHPDDDATRDEYYVVMPGPSKRRGRGFWCTSHNGDSEFAIFEIAAQSKPTWWLTEVFLSAHLGEGWGADHSGRFDASELETHGGHPIIWIAKNKHANYISKDACEGGGVLWGLVYSLV